MFIKRMISSALLVAVSLFAQSALAFEVLAPDFGVGTWWTYVKRDMLSGVELERYTNTVSGKTDTLYHIARTNASGTVISEYSITRNLGQGSPVGGNIGDGNQYNFPLAEKKKWNTKSYFLNSRGSKGFTDMSYEVLGLDDISLPSGSFPRSVKIQGSGFWASINAGGTGTINDIVHYSDVVGAPVRFERFIRPHTDKTEIVLVAYERK